MTWKEFKDKIDKALQIQNLEDADIFFIDILYPTDKDLSITLEVAYKDSKTEGARTVKIQAWTPKRRESEYES